MVILIPAYEPDERLLYLIDGPAGQRIVIIDDGSGPDYEHVFRAAAARGCIVVGHTRNRGKAYALKQGFALLGVTFPGEVVVTADCDGQHTPVDILRVGEEAGRRRDAIVLGSRRFTGTVPFRGRFGNSVTRFLFGIVTGLRIRDTQTGLRGYPPGMLDWLRSIEGDRFEYELIVLLRARSSGHTVHEIPIETIYLEENRSSHFRPIIDSARVYAPLIRFSLSSIGAALVAFVLLFVLKAATGSLLVSVVTARVGSSAFNYAADRTFVFGRRGRVSTSAMRYFGLVGVLLAANYGLMHLLNEHVGVPLLPSKFLTETTLFTLSYQAQKRFVFNDRTSQEISDEKLRIDRLVSEQPDRSRTPDVSTRSPGMTYRDISRYDVVR